MPRSFGGRAGRQESGSGTAAGTSTSSSTRGASRQHAQSSQGKHATKKYEAESTGRRKWGLPKSNSAGGRTTSSRMGSGSGSSSRLQSANSEGRLRTGSKSLQSANSEGRIRTGTKSHTTTTSPTKIFAKRNSSKRGEEQIHVVYDDFGPEAKYQLKVRTEAGAPSITAPGQVIIKIKSSTATMKDCIIRRGMWKDDGPSIELPATPGYDCVGTIYDLCPSIADDSDYRVGDTVATICRVGGNARYITVSSSDLIRVPSHCDPDKAACIVSAYITAYQALYRSWPGSNGDENALHNKRVLIIGAHQPVGLAAIELCRLFGCREVYGTAKESHHDYLKRHGARPLPYHPDDWLSEVESRIDIALDGVCQDNYDSTRASLKDTGHLVCLGADSILMNDADTGIGVTRGGWFKKQASAKLAGLKARYLGHTTNYEAWKSWKSNPQAFQQDLDHLFDLLKRGKIKPKATIKTVTLDKVAFFHHMIENDKMKEGSVIIKPWRKG